MEDVGHEHKGLPYWSEDSDPPHGGSQSPMHTCAGAQKAVSASTAKHALSSFTETSPEVIVMLISRHVKFTLHDLVDTVRPWKYAAVCRDR